MGTREQGYQTIHQIAGDRLLTDQSDYYNNRTVLSFMCCDCDTVFHTTAYLYQKSSDGKRCLSCKHRLAISGTDQRSEYIKRCVDVLGGYYSYDLIPETFKAKDYIDIVCPEHGVFSAEAHAHSKGKYGCPKCKVEKVTAATRSNVTDFIVRANDVHRYRYNYSNVVYVNAKTPIQIICPAHGDFKQTPDVHLRGSGCPRCRASSPIQEICNAVHKQGLSTITEKTFDVCVGDSKKLRFDVFVPELALCIEYDGPHHMGPFKYGNMSDEQAAGAFAKQQQYDHVKDAYCDANQLDLIRIPYTEYNPGAIVTSYIAKKTAQRYMYTYDDLHQDVKNIASYIRSFNYERFAIYGIRRGGLLFSMPLTYTFEAECEYGIVCYQRYDGNDKVVTFDIEHNTPDIPIFVIDDLISSGITMNKVVAKLKHKYKNAKVHPVVIFGEENADGVFFLHPHPKKWIVFPYENS